MLRKIEIGSTEWTQVYGPIIKNGVLPLTALSFWKFCLSIRTVLIIVIRNGKIAWKHEPYVAEY